MINVYNKIDNLIDRNTGDTYELISYDDREKHKITMGLLKYSSYLERVKSELSNKLFRFVNKPYLDMLDELIDTTNNLRSSIMSGHVYKIERANTGLYYYKISMFVDVCKVAVINLKTNVNIEEFENVKAFLDHLVLVDALSSHEASTVISINVIDKDTYERKVNHE